MGKRTTRGCVWVSAVGEVFHSDLWTFNHQMSCLAWTLREAGGVSSVAPAARLKPDKQSIMYKAVTGDLSAVVAAPPATLTPPPPFSQNNTDVTPGRLHLKRSLKFGFTARRG